VSHRSLFQKYGPSISLASGRRNEDRDAKEAVGRQRKERKRDNIKKYRKCRRKQRNLGRNTKRAIKKNKKSEGETADKNNEEKTE
jgi:hypothetical protein